MGGFVLVKVGMIVFNLFIFLGGTALLGVGIWVSVDRVSFLQVLGLFSSQAIQFANVSIFCVALGAVLILSGFLGCCGAQRNSKCLILATESTLRAWATPALQRQYGSDPAVTQIWNGTMTELKCCGFTNYTDFTDSLYYTQNGETYPPTCCTGNTSDCGPIAAANSAVKLTAMFTSMSLYCHLDKNIRYGNSQQDSFHPQVTCRRFPLLLQITEKILDDSVWK